jgi:hypothetical protein
VCRELLEQYRRTGEPSLALQYLRLGWGENDTGWGKAKGSYTELLRSSFFEWLEEKNGGWAAPLTFEYRLSRKKYITVVGVYPYILHDPNYGSGKKGFVLRLQVISMDGLPYRGIGRFVWFAWDRIVGKEKMLALPEGMVK